jgi:hypothetical protein
MGRETPALIGLRLLIAGLLITALRIWLLRIWLLGNGKRPCPNQCKYAHGACGCGNAAFAVPGYETLQF